jgi:hypothetical protein
MAASFKVIELGQNELSLWDRLLAGSSQATVFSSTLFGNALADATGKSYRFLAVFRGEKLIAGLPVFELRWHGLLTAQQPPLVPHLGLLISNEIEDDHQRGREFNVFEASKVLSEWLSGKYDYVSFAHHPSLIDVRPFLWRGWNERACYTYRIKLSAFGPETVHYSIRKQIAKAERDKVQIEESLDTGDLMNMAKMSFGKRGRDVPFTQGYLETVFGRLASNGRAKLYYARNAEGKRISSRIILDSFGTVYDWVAGADPAHYDSGATPYLLYTIIERSKPGHTSFDLMGANTPSIALFKSNFGGEITPYYLTNKSCNIKGAAALAFYKLLRAWRKT